MKSAIAGLVLISLSSAFAAPANDHFINPILLSGTNLTVSGSNEGATKEVGEPNHAAPGGRSVWWEWTSPGVGTVIIRTAGSSFDTLLAVYTGGAVAELSDSLIASNDDAGRSETSLVVFNTEAGVRYRIVVDGFNGDSGSIRMTLAYSAPPLPRPPVNDSFAQRVPLEGPNLTATGASYFATKEPGEPDHAYERGGASLWWSWTPPVSGRVVIDTAGSDFDTLLAVYEGSVLTNLVPVARNDDVSTNQVTSALTCPVTAGTVYAIAVDGFNGEPGVVQLNLAMDVVWFSQPRLASGRCQLTLSGAIGQPFTLQASSDLVHWEPLTTLFSSTGTIAFTDPADRGLRFYRALTRP
jgi:hypothetical protein